MDFDLLHLNVKCEMDVKEEILVFTDDQLKNEGSEEQLTQDALNEYQAIVTSGNEIFIKEEPKDPFPEEGLTFNQYQSEEFKNLETFETEEIMKACYNYRETESTQHLRGFTSEYEDESKMNIENFTKNMSESFSKEGERMFQCHLCSFRTNKKWTLKRHLLVHSNLKRFKCIQCGAEFKQKSDMNAHLIVHSDIKPFECSYCGLTFKRKKDLKVHLVKHSDIKLFICSYCGSTFKWKNELKSHEAEHSDVTPIDNAHPCMDFASQICDDSTRTTILEKEHNNGGETKTVQKLKGLTSEKEKKLKVKKENDSFPKEKSRDFHCHLCSFRTYKKWTLKRHLLVHSNLKECDLNAHSQKEIVTNLKCIARNLNAYEHNS